MPASSPSSGWIVDTGRSEVGPVSSGDLKRMAETGRLTPAMRVRKDGGDWRPASELRGLDFPDPHGAAGPRSTEPAPSVGRLGLRLQWINAQIVARSLLDRMQFGSDTLSRITAAFVPAAVFFVGILGVAIAADIPTVMTLFFGGVAMATVVVASAVLVAGRADETLHTDRAAATTELAAAREAVAAQKVRDDVSRDAAEQAAWVARREAAARAAAKRFPCPYCGEPVRPDALKCQHCHEIIDIQLAADRAQPTFNPGIAAVLSLFLPGVGQIYRRQILIGLIWFVFMPGVYFVGGVLAVCTFGLSLIPAVLLHLVCIITAAAPE